ncbi:MAG: hypothetical protein JST86_12215 [Bacteroidetes bacterium]|nr:hypothetical protein [Bacteroidota bacterium]
MKQGTITLAFILGAFISFAQIQKIERPEPVIKKIIAPAPAPAGTVQGKDLSIAIKSFQYDPSSNGTLHITYTVKNNGTDAVDLNNVSVQGYIDDPQQYPSVTPPTYLVNGKYYYAGGGQAIATSTTMLNSGQSMDGTMNLFNLAREHYFNTASSYNYLLVVDKGNIVNEANENNNTTTYTFRGYQGQYQPSVNPSQYYLSAAYMIIKTGADNKEKQSEVDIRVIPSTIKNLTDTYNEFIKKVSKNELEFYSNGTQVLPLGLYMSGTAYLVNPATSLSAFNSNGLGAVIEYKANIFTDAWKIDQVQLVLHFKDVNGFYHPTQGLRVITFNMPANTFLDGFAKHYLVCKTDLSLNPVLIKTIDKLSAY